MAKSNFYIAVDHKHENGVLTLRLPKSATVKPKKITVKTVVEPKK